MLTSYEIKSIAENIAKQVSVSVAEVLIREISSSVAEAFARSTAEEIRKMTDTILTDEDVCEMIQKSKSTIKRMCNDENDPMPVHEKLGTRYYSKNEVMDYFTEKNKN